MLISLTCLCFCIWEQKIYIIYMFKICGISSWMFIYMYLFVFVPGEAALVLQWKGKIKVAVMISWTHGCDIRWQLLYILWMFLSLVSLIFKYFLTFLSCVLMTFVFFDKGVYLISFVFETHSYCNCLQISRKHFTVNTSRGYDNRCFQILCISRYLIIILFTYSGWNYIIIYYSFVCKCYFKISLTFQRLYNCINGLGI